MQIQQTKLSKKMKTKKRKERMHERKKERGLDMIGWLMCMLLCFFDQLSIEQVPSMRASGQECNAMKC
jgi:hypothetical protein